jgi:ribonuclease P protein component
MQTFSKDERLCSEVLFSELLEKGSSFFVHPFKVVWLKTEHPGKSPVQLAISVPKKKFKRAVQRNRVKRLIREAYRKNKQELYSALAENELKLTVLVVYTAATEPPYSEVESKIKLILQRLVKEHAQSA